MANEAMSMPEDGGATGTREPSSPGALSFLTAEWVNRRVGNVADRVDSILEKIIDFGLLADGFAPFESPITDDMLIRMGPEQFRALFDTIPTFEEKAALLARIHTLKLPLPIELPFRPPEAQPVKAPRLAFGPQEAVHLGSTEV